MDDRAGQRRGDSREAVTEQTDPPGTAQTPSGEATPIYAGVLAEVRTDEDHTATDPTQQENPAWPAESNDAH